jgi:hypothetical protein
MWADYQRGVSALDRISVQSFVSNAAFLRTGGQLGARMQLALSAGYARGRAGAAFELGNYENTTLTTQVSYGIARCCSATVNYNFMRYLLVDIEPTVTTIPANLSRQAVRAGMSISLPFYRSRTRTARSRRDRS